MACSRCGERGKAIKSAVSAIGRGNLRSAGQSAAFVGRTFGQDLQSGAIKAAAASRLAQLRNSLKR